MNSLLPVWMRQWHVLVLFGISLVPISKIAAQDTLLTNYPNSNQRWEKIYEQDEKVEEHIYYESRKNWMSVKYEGPKKEHWDWYYENGNPYFSATIIEDQLQGSYRIWYENGQLAESIVFRDNLEDGMAVFFHPNGQIAMKGRYSKGEMIGEWQFYDYNGQLPIGAWSWAFGASLENVRVKGQFSKGKPSGTWTYWATANQGRANQKVFSRQYPD